MKKIAIYILVLLSLTMFCHSASRHLLRIEKPPATDQLLLLIEDLDNFIAAAGLKSSKQEVHLRLYNPQGRKVAKLAKIKKGKVKWLFKKQNKTHLKVKLDTADEELLWNEVQAKKKKSSYQLVLTAYDGDSKRANVLKQQKLSFTPYLDLNAVMTYPIAVAPGSNMRNKVSVTIFNQGNIPAENFYIEILLSKDNKLPLKPAVYSKHFQEDMRLKGGRLLIDQLKPGHSVQMTFAGAMTIPIDTIEGRYSLGAVLDPENLIPESDETNNQLARMIIITKDPDKILKQLNAKPVEIPPKVDKDY